MPHSIGGLVRKWRFAGGDFKLVRYDTNADSGSARGQNVSSARLYNLVADLGESQDLAATMPEKVRELQSKWDAWNTTLVPPLWGGKGAANNVGKNRSVQAKGKRRKAKEDAPRGQQ